MKKHITRRLAIISILFFISCHNKNLSIEPIDKRFNDAEEWQFQYYQISNYKNLSDKDLLNKLEYFVKNKYPLKKYADKELHIYFYKKSIFANYKKCLDEMTVENVEFGGIDEYRGNLIAAFFYWKIDDNKKSYTGVIYDNDNPKDIYIQRLVKEDTISIR